MAKQTVTILLLTTFTVNCLEPILLVHGGADTAYNNKIRGRIDGVKKATISGYKILKSGGSALDAVEEAVKSMEDDPHFNSGFGSLLNLDGEVEMDAAVMRGSNLSSGAVTAVKNVKHPVSLARLVMEKSPHFLLAGAGAKRFAAENGVILVHGKTLVSPEATASLEEYKKAHIPQLKQLELGMACGGVGAVAIDTKGQVAAASSSGGRLAKFPGRSSDAAIVGAGLYADDDVGAVVVTGHGEAISSYVLAYEIISSMKKGFEAGIATREAVKGITTRFHRPTGAIAISKRGNVGISFTTDKLPWAYQIGDDLHYGADDYNQHSEKIRN